MAGDSRRLTLQIDSDNLRWDRESGSAEMFLVAIRKLAAQQGPYLWAMRLHPIRSKMV